MKEASLFAWRLEAPSEQRSHERARGKYRATETVIEDNRRKAEGWLAANPVKPRSMLGLATILAIWALCGRFLWHWIAH
jgi:hypothetical protein